MGALLVGIKEKGEEREVNRLSQEKQSFLKKVHEAMGETKTTKSERVRYWNYNLQHCIYLLIK